NTALGSARTVLCVISQVSVTKEWPLAEVNTALSMDVIGQKRVVPLIVGSPDLSKLPLIRGRDQLVWRGDAETVAAELVKVVRPPTPEVTKGGAAVPVIAPNSPAEAKRAAQAKGAKKGGGFFGLFRKK
ncbi:MAG: hypothetical protein FD124_2478, partial [Alphaproteobacteria bacterium]